MVSGLAMVVLLVCLEQHGKNGTWCSKVHCKLQPKMGLGLAMVVFLAFKGVH